MATLPDWDLAEASRQAGQPGRMGTRRSRYAGPRATRAGCVGWPALGRHPQGRLLASRGRQFVIVLRRISSYSLPGDRRTRVFSPSFQSSSDVSLRTHALPISAAGNQIVPPQVSIVLRRISSYSRVPETILHLFQSSSFQSSSDVSLRTHNLDGCLDMYPADRFGSFNRPQTYLFVLTREPENGRAGPVRVSIVLRRISSYSPWRRNCRLRERSEFQSSSDVSLRTHFFWYVTQVATYGTP